MESKLALASLCCVLAGCYSAQTGAGKHEQINLDWNGGAEYFHFPESAQLKVAELNCPATATVSVTCRTTTHARCGSWNLGVNGTATAGAKADTGIASINYNGPPEICTATLVIESP